jgi:DUF438 domain-containing protein
MNRQHTPSQGPIRFFQGDHRYCDALWADVERAADAEDQAATRDAFAAFDAAMRMHFDLEEEILFPAFEDATGMHGGGPTHVMRYEHGQMRALLDRLASSAERGDTGAVLDGGDTLLMLVQQHNAKEENMLYPMTERALAPGWAALASRIDAKLSS